MRCVVSLARISARKWSIILGFAVLRGRVYEEPLKQWEWLLGVVLYSSIFFFYHLMQFGSFMTCL